MSVVWVLVLTGHLLTVCLAQTDETIGASLALVTKECNSKLAHVTSLESFGQFMNHFRLVTGASVKPKRGILNLEGKLRACYDNKDQLFELEELIKRQDEGVCSQSYVDKLVNYHLQHVVKRPKGGEDLGESLHRGSSHLTPIKTSYAARVFSLFAHQVTYTCKQHLLARVESIQAQQDCSNVLSEFLPPEFLKEADGSSPRDGELDEFSNFLRNFKRVEDFATIGKQMSFVGPYFDVVVSQNVIDKIQRLKSRCRTREPYYSALFAPIATLSQLGYDIQEPTVDSDSLVGRHSKLLKCWLASAQLCQGVLRTHLTLDSDSQPGASAESGNLDDENKLIKIKFGQVPEDVAQLSEGSLVPPGVLDFKDSVSEFSKDVIDLVGKKASLKGKIRRRALKWARQFVEHNIDIDGRQSEMKHAFVDALTRDENEQDSNVAFNGKKRDHGVYRPGSLITDSADTISSAVSMFVQKEIALVFSSAVAICLSAVFVWFTLYALISSLRSTTVDGGDKNFKANWRAMRDQRMKTLDDKMKRKGWKDKLSVYRSQTS